MRTEPLLLLCFSLIPVTRSMHGYGMEFPHAVAIMDGNNFTCQGINLDGKVVVTAAYCVPEDKVFEIRTGFTTATGSLKKSSFKTTSEHIAHLELRNTSLANNNIALVYLKDTIPVTPVSKPANIEHCSSPINMTSCVIIFWNVKGVYQEACAALISVRRGMCQNMTIANEHLNPREKMCGKTNLCLPDTTGASLTCGRSVVGIVVKSVCRHKNGGTELVFLNLAFAFHQIESFQEKENNSNGQSNLTTANRKSEIIPEDVSKILKYLQKKSPNIAQSVLLCWQTLFLTFLFM